MADIKNQVKDIRIVRQRNGWLIHVEFHIGRDESYVAIGSLGLLKLIEELLEGREIDNNG